LFEGAAIQHTNSRSPYFDGVDYVMSPESAINPIIPGRGLYFWLNVEVHACLCLFGISLQSIEDLTKCTVDELQWAWGVCLNIVMDVCTRVSGQALKQSWTGMVCFGYHSGIYKEVCASFGYQ
jgi:hypothetical protein